MTTSSSLDAPEFDRILTRLHQQAERQMAAIRSIPRDRGGDHRPRTELSAEEQARQFKDLLLPLSAETGRFAYLVARSLGARRIVEFGTSFGVSTLYLAAAVKDNGGGLVIGSELEPGKVQRAREHLDEAGLGKYAEVREGDARQTLSDVGGPVDLVLLDGWKELYLPVFELLAPQLRQGGVVLADNMNHTETLAPYAARVRVRDFQSVTLPLGDGTEYSVKLA
jgi:predicted O-methyltransferase YrrM